MPSEHFLIEKPGIWKLEITPIKLNLYLNTLKIHFSLMMTFSLAIV